MLYVTVDRSVNGFQVIALGAAGEVVATYTAPMPSVGGNISQGKIAFDGDGHFYVGTGGGVVKFTVGDPHSGVLISSDQAFDIEVLPSGHLLVANGVNLEELTSDGELIRFLDVIDPNDVSDGNLIAGLGLSDNRGVEYDPGSNAVFATMLGYSGFQTFQFQLEKFDFETGILLNTTTFIYGDDMFLTSDDLLVVGSRTQPYGVFDLDLNIISSFGAPNGLFVTQDPVGQVPEPATFGLLALGLIIMRRTFNPRRPPAISERQ
jgi:hypothetical protein